MHLIAVAWIYVVLMMAVAEAISANGTVLGAFFTFVLYGVLPLSLVMYIVSTPGRKRARRRAEAAEAARWAQQQDAPQAAGEGASAAPDHGGVAAGDAVAPVRKEP